MRERDALATAGKMPALRGGGGYCFRIQLDILSSAIGDIVSSICAYSAREPVFAVWKRWLSPGSSSISKCSLPPCFQVVVGRLDNVQDQTQFGAARAESSLPIAAMSCACDRADEIRSTRKIRMLFMTSPSLGRFPTGPWT